MEALSQLNRTGIFEPCYKRDALPLIGCADVLCRTATAESQCMTRLLSIFAEVQSSFILGLV